MPESDTSADKAQDKKSKKTDDADVTIDMADEEPSDAEAPAEKSSEVAVEEAPKESVSADKLAATSGDGKFKRYLRAYWRRKKWTLPVTVLVLLGLLAAIPATRYPIFALWMQRDVQLLVSDDSTHKPVASAQVTLDGHAATTDNQGKAMIKAKVGKRHVSVSKKYYGPGDVDVFVGLKGQVKAEVSVKATGRQVPLKVVNKLSHKPIENALIKAADTEVKTDKDGKATLVLPAGKTTLPVEVSNDGFNATKSNLTVTESEVPANTFQLTPSGKVYFLSKKSGTIDVVKTNLDGSDREAVVTGTGKEDDRGTVLLASRDWHYLALLSRRDSDLPKLYLIDTSNDKMTTMDEGNADFNLIGWSDNNFVYTVTRRLNVWQSGRIAIKSFNASSSKLTQIDQSEADGTADYNYVSQYFNSIYLLGSKLVYVVSWSASSNVDLSGRNDSIRTASADGKDKKDLKLFSRSKYSGGEMRPYAPNEMYIQAYVINGNNPETYEYDEGVVKPAQIDSSKFNKPYPTFLLSPSGKHEFWSEQRDGVDTFFVGNQDAADAKQIGAFDEHKVYGWYGDDYVLISEKDSQLYIMPADGSAAPTKVTDYHKPDVSYFGYGGGYGGL